jgi:hypothetical protein
MNNLNKIIVVVFFVFCAVILALGLRGIPGNPTSESMNEVVWKDEGPMELSPERGRFALTMSVVEDNSFHYSLPIARFTTPDLGYSEDGKYVSLFAPLMSFLIIPGYVLGKALGISQVGTYAVVAVFALLNAVLIRVIAIRLKAHPAAALVGAFAYLFATPAFAYAVSLYQHQFSTLLILMSIYLLLRFKNAFALAGIWFLFALSIPLDYPNLFLMLPIAIFATGRIIYTSYTENNISLNVRFPYLSTYAVMIIPLIFFFWFNAVSYGNPLQLSGTVPTVKSFDAVGNPVVTTTNEIPGEKKKEESVVEEKSALKFFYPRNLLNGFYIHFVSPDRGILT